MVTTRKQFKFIVHVDISDERMGKAAGRVFRERHRRVEGLCRL